MVTVKFFGQITTLVKCRELVLTDVRFANVDELRKHLAQRDKKWALALLDSSVLSAVNHTFCDYSQCLNDGDEVAFFPPVTGG